MDEKMKFIARLLEGETMTSLCIEFGISRKTGYKIWDRYQSSGLEALTDRSRRPIRFGNQMPFQIESYLLNLKKEYPSWGAPKIREKFARRYPDIKPPAKSTIHALFDKHDLVQRKTRRRYKAEGTALSNTTNPNDLWCTDFKGEFMLGDHRYCYPLTITDYASRFLIACEGLESTRESTAFTVYENIFKEFGLPKAIRSDNGVPFAAPNSLFGLSKLSIWWLRLGISIERIKPGHPEQNGRHERMHLTLKKEATKPAGLNFLQQQAKFDNFISEFNNERPHQAIDMKYPAEIYKKSERIYNGLPEVNYPLHDKTIFVTSCGRVCVRNKKVHISSVFAEQSVVLHG
jgi:putative transposase